MCSILKERKGIIPTDRYSATVIPHECKTYPVVYACEIWGYENLSIIDKFHLRFVKMILKVKKTTPNCMVYGELGELPLSTTVACRMIRFWANLISGHKETYLVYID
jgi:hypothetical protein